jgi:hypothetical protein
MSVTPNQIVAYGCAQMPEADSVTVGGAVDFTKRVMFADLPYVGLNGSANTDTIDIVSGTSGDTGVKIQISGRDGAGVIQTPAVAQLNGTAVVSYSVQLFQRLEYAVITGGSIGGLSNPGGTAATSDVAAMSHKRIVSGHTSSGSSANTSGVTPPLFGLQAGDGTAVGAAVYNGLGVIIRITGGPGAGQLRMVSVGYNGTASYGTDIVAINRDWGVLPTGSSTYDLAYGMLFDILPNPVVAITRLFVNSSADIPGGATRTYYDKFFLVNTNGTTSLVNAQVEFLSESPALPIGAALDLALGSALNDNTTIANRQTAPANTGGFIVQPSLITVPGGGTIPFGNAASGAVACWARLTLNPGTATYQGAVDARAIGNTT